MQKKINKVNAFLWSAAVFVFAGKADEIRAEPAPHPVAYIVDLGYCTISLKDRAGGHVTDSGAFGTRAYISQDFGGSEKLDFHLECARGQSADYCETDWKEPLAADARTNDPGYLADLNQQWLHNFHPRYSGLANMQNQTAGPRPLHRWFNFCLNNGDSWVTGSVRYENLKRADLTRILSIARSIHIIGAHP